MPAPPRTAGDGLTRTTLLMDDNPSQLAIERVIAALKRVPGVLLAELGPGTPQAIVAHDAAVANATLLEAAAESGVHARLAASPRAPVLSGAVGQLPLGKERERLLLIGAVVFIGAFAFSAVGPPLANSHTLLPIALAFAWAFVIARAVLSRRP
jgi:hypothetical protein